MKHIAAAAAVAAVVSGVITYSLPGRLATDHQAAMLPAPADAPASVPAASGPLRLRYTDALVEDVWIDASRTAGSDHRSLTSVGNSICFITKIEIGGIQAPEDRSSCSMQIDEFTGFWDLVATVEEGGRSQIRCNARCLVWE